MVAGVTVAGGPRRRGQAHASASRAASTPSPCAEPSTGAHVEHLQAATSPPLRRGLEISYFDVPGDSCGRQFGEAATRIMPQVIRYRTQPARNLKPGHKRQSRAPVNRPRHDQPLPQRRRKRLPRPAPNDANAHPDRHHGHDDNDPDANRHHRDDAESKSLESSRHDRPGYRNHGHFADDSDSGVFRIDRHHDNSALRDDASDRTDDDVWLASPLRYGVGAVGLSWL